MLKFDFLPYYKVPPKSLHLLLLTPMEFSIKLTDESCKHKKCWIVSIHSCPSHGLKQPSILISYRNSSHPNKIMS